MKADFFSIKYFELMLVVKNEAEVYQEQLLKGTVQP